MFSVLFHQLFASCKNYVRWSVRSFKRWYTGCKHRIHLCTYILACLNHTKTSQPNRVGLTGGLCRFERGSSKDIQHCRKFRTDSSSVGHPKLWMIFDKIIELPKTYFLREFWNQQSQWMVDHLKCQQFLLMFKVNNAFGQTYFHR